MYRRFLPLAALSLSVPAMAQPDADNRPISLETVRAEPGFHEFIAGVREAFRMGPVRPDWNRGGVDLPTAAPAEAGGGAPLLVGRTEGGDLDIVAVAPVALADLVSPGWIEVATEGDIDAELANTELTVGTMGGIVAVAVRVRLRRVGTAYCGGELLGAKLYRLPGGEGYDRQSAGLLFASLVDTMRERPYCLVWTHQPDGSFSDSSFLPDGTSLPALDERETLHWPRPVMPVERLLAEDDPGR